MNERIKELAKQAGAHVSIRNLMSNPPQQVETVELWDDRIEKFAELIVRDCVNVLNKRYMGDNNREDMEVRRCIEDVTRHFGVEQ